MRLHNFYSKAFRKILVPWNFSKNSELSLGRALCLAGPETRIYVVHIAPPLSGPDAGAHCLTAEGNHRSFIRKRFRKLKPELVNDSRICFDSEFGFVATEIARYADRIKADLIIVTERERSKLQNFLAGNIVQKVQKLSTCPVKVVQLPK